MRRRHSSPTVSVDIDVSLDELETKDLIEELKVRGSAEPHSDHDELEELHRLLRLRSYSDAMALIERLIWPKWSNTDRCTEDFLAAKKAA